MLLEGAQAAGPLVLVLEDLHWADPSTLDLLALRVQTGRLPGCAVVATYRSDELAWPSAGPGDRGDAVHQPQDRGRARLEHPGQLAVGRRVEAAAIAERLDLLDESPAR